jgi:hypothetical protein
VILLCSQARTGRYKICRGPTGPGSLPKKIKGPDGPTHSRPETQQLIAVNRQPLCRPIRAFGPAQKPFPGAQRAPAVLVSVLRALRQQVPTGLVPVRSQARTRGPTQLSGPNGRSDSALRLGRVILLCSQARTGRYKICRGPTGPGSLPKKIKGPDGPTHSRTETQQLIAVNRQFLYLPSRH